MGERSADGKVLLYEISALGVKPRGPLILNTHTHTGMHRDSPFIIYIAIVNCLLALIYLKFPILDNNPTWSSG